MNYYPQYNNPNIPYQPNNTQQYNIPNQMPQYTPQYQTQQFPQQQYIGLNGKIVDSIDMVKATEVPVGGYGVFPKGDMSEVYIKQWNMDGTASIVTFKPVIPTEKVTSPMDDTLSQILEKLNSLEEKINGDSHSDTKEGKRR